MAKSQRAAGYRLPSPSPSQQKAAAHPLFFFDRAPPSSPLTASNSCPQLFPIFLLWSLSPFKKIKTEPPSLLLIFAPVNQHKPSSSPSNSPQTSSLPHASRPPFGQTSSLQRHPSSSPTSLPICFGLLPQTHGSPFPLFLSQTSSRPHLLPHSSRPLNLSQPPNTPQRPSTALPHLPFPISQQSISFTANQPAHLDQISASNKQRPKK